MICERNDPPINLVITEAIMPQISGKELARRLAKLNPQIKILMMSGYTNRAAESLDIPAYRGFLQKPFTLKTRSSGLKTPDSRLATPDSRLKTPGLPWPTVPYFGGYW